MGSKRGSSVSVAPTPIAVLSPQVRPKTWNSGRPPKTTSSGKIPNNLPDSSAFFVNPACVSSAPFGVPVVPDVYRITAVSSSSRSTTSAAGPAEPRSSLKVAGSTSTHSAPAAAAPSSAASANPCHASSTFAPESSR